MRRVLSREELEETIRGLARALATEEGCPLGFSLVEENESALMLRKGRKKVQIHLFAPLASPPGGGAMHWRFGYDLEDAALLARDSVETLDFRRLWHSPHPSPLLRRTMSWLRYRYGLRFADIRDRAHFTVFPPPLREKTED